MRATSRNCLRSRLPHIKRRSRYRNLRFWPKAHIRWTTRQPPATAIRRWIGWRGADSLLFREDWMLGRATRHKSLVFACFVAMLPNPGWAKDEFCTRLYAFEAAPFDKDAQGKPLRRA